MESRPSWTANRRAAGDRAVWLFGEGNKFAPVVADALKATAHRSMHGATYQQHAYDAADAAWSRWRAIRQSGFV